MNCDELDDNPFLEALLDPRNSDFLVKARKGSWTVCVPVKSVLFGVLVDGPLLRKHVLMPSKFVVNEFQVVGGGMAKLRGKSITVTAEGASKGVPVEATVVGEDKIFDSKLPALNLLIIDAPLVLPSSLKRVLVPAHEMYFVGAVSSCDYVRALARLSGEKSMLQCERECGTFCTSFVLLPTALDLTALKLKAICDATIEELRCGGQLKRCEEDSHFQREVEVAVNCFVMTWVHKKILDSLQEFMKHKDAAILQVLSQLQSPDDYGIRAEVVCDFPTAVQTLSELDKLITPLDKLVCLKQTAEAIVTDVRNSNTDYVVELTADDMISILLLVLQKSTVRHPYASLAYAQHFAFATAMISRFGYHLSTFEAALEYLLSLSPNTLPAFQPPTTIQLNRSQSHDDRTGKRFSLPQTRERGTTFLLAQQNPQTSKKPQQQNPPQVPQQSFATLQRNSGQLPAKVISAGRGQPNQMHRMSQPPEQTFVPMTIDVEDSKPADLSFLNSFG